MIDAGNVIDVSYGQSTNADASIVVNFVAFAGIDTFTSFEQLANILSEIISKFVGNVIDSNDVHLANDSLPTHDPYG